MGERGQVVGVQGDQVEVRLTRTEACAKCGACAAGLSSEEMIITAKNICGAAEQDWVVVELESGNFLSAALILYGIPLVLLLTGFLAGFYAARALGSPVDAPVGFVAGVLLMWLGFRWIHRREEKWKARGYIPVAVQRVGQ